MPHVPHRVDYTHFLNSYLSSEVWWNHSMAWATRAQPQTQTGQWWYSFFLFKPNPNPILTKLEDEVGNSEDSDDSNYIFKSGSNSGSNSNYDYKDNEEDNPDMEMSDKLSVDTPPRSTTLPRELEKWGSTPAGGCHTSLKIAKPCSGLELMYVQRGKLFQDRLLGIYSNWTIPIPECA